MEDGVGAVLVVNTPPEFNLWDNGKLNNREELVELLTRILNDKDWLTYPTEDEFVDMVLSKIKIYKSSLLTYKEDDKILAQAILTLFEQLYTGLMSKEIDAWQLIDVSDIDQSTITFKIYF